jgi:integrase/recombinase XerD
MYNEILINTNTLNMETTNNVKLVVDYCKHKQWSERTITNYSYALKRFLLAFPKVYQHDHISDADISDYLLKIEGRSSRCTAHSVIKLWFMIKGQKNKLKFVPYPEKQDKLPIHVNKQEFLQIMSVCTNEKHRVIIALMFDCGLRVSEVVNLKISDIDASNMQLKIIQAKGRKDRIVKLSKLMLMLINNYIEIYKPVYWILNGQKPKGTTETTQYTTRSCEQIVIQLREKAGITKKFTPHKFRHGYAMNLLENGTDLNRIANQMGHNSTKTTEIYARMNNNVIQSIESPLEQIFKNQINNQNEINFANLCMLGNSNHIHKT